MGGAEYQRDADQRSSKIRLLKFEYRKTENKRNNAG